MVQQYASRRKKISLIYLIATVALTASACSGSSIPEGARELPPGPDGRRRVELTTLPSDTPKLATRLKNEVWKINVGLPEGWAFYGEYKDQDSPARLLVKRPSGKKDGDGKPKNEHELIVHCWKDVSDLRILTEKSAATIRGAPTLKPLSEQTGPIRTSILRDEPAAPQGPVWIVPGAGVPAEVHMYFAFHDTGFQTVNPQGEVTGKFLLRSHRTIYVIVKPAPSPGGCNYGLTLHEYTDGPNFETKLSGHAMAIASSLQ